MEGNDSIRDILGRLRPSPRSFFAFESIALRLLEEHLKESGKRLQTDSEIAGGATAFKHQVDAIVREGVDRLPGPTLVEIKFFRHSRLPLDIIDKVAMLAKRVQCNSVLLIIEPTHKLKIDQKNITKL